MHNFSVYDRPGEANLNAKTNSRAVAVIRVLGLRKEWTVRKLAGEFGLSPSAIQNILRGKTWTEVDVAAHIAELHRHAMLLGIINHSWDAGARAAGDDVSRHYEVETAQVHTGASRRAAQVHTSRDVYSGQVSTGASQVVHKQARTPGIEPVYTVEEVLAAFDLTHEDQFTPAMLRELDWDNTRVMMRAVIDARVAA